jgi:RDD family
MWTENMVQLIRTLLRAAMLLGMLFSFGWAFWGPYREIGMSMETGAGGTNVSAGTSPIAIIASIVMLAIYGLIVSNSVEIGNTRVASIGRRVAASVLDLWLVVFSMGALSGYCAVLVEAHRTGQFRWYFERDYAVATDSLAAALVFISLSALVAYFLLPLIRGSQTVGGWIFKVVTVNLEGYLVVLPVSQALRRLYAVFRGLISPLKTLRGRDDQGRTPYDLESGYTMVSY